MHDRSSLLHRFWLSLLVLGLALWLSSLWLQAGFAQTPDAHPLAVASPNLVATEEPSLAAAIALAAQAQTKARQARLTTDWQTVADLWMAAIATLQTVPLNDPRHPFAARRLAEYGKNWLVAQHNANQSSFPVIYPTFNSPVLDEQVVLYLSYVAALGPPDILIVGSSRALQGIDPQVLSQSLHQRGLVDVRAYNFSINGATAQVVNLLLQQVVSTQPLPRVVIWADGSRAFNDGRPDRTYEAILRSPGYQRLRQGQPPHLNLVENTSRRRPPTSENVELQSDGFYPVRSEFLPSQYFQNFPRILGRYDSDYRQFRLTGLQAQALARVVQFTRLHQIPLIFVSLPLSGEYLDPVRQRYEQQFRTFMRQQASRDRFLFLDFSLQWPTLYHYFADPSHINAAGAALIAQSLANHTQIPWDSFGQ